MGAINPIGGETRVMRADHISETEESVYEVTCEIDRSSEALDDLNDSLRTLEEKHRIYKIKADRAKKMMRRLSTEL